MNVNLIDGTEVASDSEAWRHECEVRAILALPTLADRRAWLEKLEAKRGKKEADKLRKKMGEIWDREHEVPK